MRRLRCLLTAALLALVLAAIPCDDAVAADILWFTATGGTQAITLSWETFTESNTLGYNLYRSDSADGPRTRLNAELIPPGTYSGSPFGSVYEYQDLGVALGQRLFYWLEHTSVYGRSLLYGPVDAVARSDWRLNLPLVMASHRCGLDSVNSPVPLAWGTLSAPCGARSVAEPLPCSAATIIVATDREQVCRDRRSPGRVHVTGQAHLR